MEVFKNNRIISISFKRGKEIMSNIIVDQLSAGYKNLSVFKNANLSISKGEIVALIGPNGAGKSTFMKVLAGLKKPTTGTVKIDGISYKDNYLEYNKLFSAIIETPSFYEELSGIDNLKFISNLNRVDKREIEKIVDFIDIGKAINRKVKTYSLGMKQRLALGMAMVSSPHFLILDEPTNGLDPQGVIEFRKLLENLAKEKDMSIIISSHILAELEKIATKIWYISDGKIKEADTSSHQDNLQIITLALKNNEDGDKIRKEASCVQETELIRGNKIRISILKDDSSKFLSYLSENNIEFDDIEIRNSSFEELYNNIYGGK